MATEHDDDQQHDDIAGLRKAAKDGKAALTENETLRRELMFAKAGINTETRLGKMLLKTFEGTSLEELTAEAEEIGLLKSADAEQPAPQPDNDDAAQGEFRRNLSGGQAGGEQTSPDPITSALTEFHASTKNGMRREDAAVVAVDKVFKAAASGDKRAIFNPDEWSQKASLASGNRG